MNVNSASTLWIGGAEQDRLGPIWVAVSETGLVAVLMKASESQIRRLLQPAQAVIDEERTGSALSQIAAYLDGQRRELEIPVDWSVLEPFHARVLQLVHRIPYGQTRTYGEIAGELDMTNGARAVGRANATNPMPLVIPCHRVVGSNGRLHGYGGPGGVATKAWLLQLEGSRLL